MSGRNDSPVFSNLSTLSGFYEIKLVPPLNSRELFFLSLVRSKPPPVINYFLALLYCYYRSFASSCYLICFLSASSALLCVYFLLSSSSIYFLIFSSANLCLQSSAFLLLYSYFRSLSCLFFSSSSFSLSDTWICNSSSRMSVYSRIIQKQQRPDISTVIFRFASQGSSSSLLI